MKEKGWKDIKLKKAVTNFFDPILFGMTWSKRTRFIHNNLDKLNYNLDLFENCKSWYQGSEIDCDKLIDLNTQNLIYDFVRPHKLLITGANYCEGYLSY